MPPPTEPMTYTAELDHLKSFVPKLVTIDGIPNLESREVVVNFPDVNSTKYPHLEKVIELYCWPTNAKPQLWVEDPTIEGVGTDGILNGKWRLARAAINMQKALPGLTIVLREGYATELMWDEAFLASEDYLQESEKYIEVIFPNIDPQATQKIVDAIPEYTDEDITIRKHVYPATAANPWEYLRVHPEPQDDGSNILRLFVAQPQYTEVLYDNYGSPDQRTKTYVHNVPKRLAQGVVNTYNLVEGTSGSASYSTDQGTVDLIFYGRNTTQVTIRNVKTVDACAYEEYTDYWYGYTKAEAEAFDLNTVYGAYKQGYEYSVDGLSYSGNGNYTIKSSQRQVKTKTHASLTTYHADAEADTTITIKSGQSSLPAVTTSQGIVQWIRAAVDRFCTFSTQKFIRTSKEWEEAFQLTTKNGIHYHTLKGNQREIAFGTPREGYVHQLSGFKRNEDQTYNWHTIEVPSLFAGDGLNENYWSFRTSRTATVKITKGTDEGKYQRLENVYQWIYKTKRFTTEAEAYAYLREHVFYKQSSFVKAVGPNQFVGHKIALEADFGWQKTGAAFTGA